MVYRVGRAFAILGVIGIWLLFAALTGFYLLAILSPPGIGDGDRRILAFALLFVLAVPSAAWLAYRTGGAAGGLIFVVVGIAIPVLWVPQVPPDWSDPVQVLTRLVVLLGAATTLGGILMITRGRRRDGPRRSRGGDGVSSAGPRVDAQEE